MSTTYAFYYSVYNKTIRLRMQISCIKNYISFANLIKFIIKTLFIRNFINMNTFLHRN